uniref:Uncharacterized protein n=1 Tax=Aegilops tauschii subsp. strangulata TaxID=200361 RepID=A0A453SF96_AEGTS
MEKVSDTSIEALIRRLRLHQAPPSPYSGDPSTAATPAAANLFQPRRAAVLVCLFHDAAGELSVSSSPSALPHSPPTPGRLHCPEERQRRVMLMMQQRH